MSARTFFEGWRTVIRSEPKRAFGRNRIAKKQRRTLLAERLEPRSLLSGNPIVTVDTNFGNFQIELRPDVAPLTVANFLSYVTSGAYGNMIFHRSVPGFIEQTGGFTSASPTFASTSQFATIATKAPVQNEFHLSNVRGTVAMAKVGNDPNSATDQWFVNLADNSSNLDNQNGGFTVFGDVIGDGMQVLDKIAALPVDNADSGGTFGQLPLGPGNELARISSVVVDSIDGKVFNDINVNGQKDAAEQGLAGRTVFLDNDGSGAPDAQNPSATTDANGGFVFGNLAAGTYTVREVMPPGARSTTAAETVTVTANGPVTGVDLGEASLSTLSPLPATSRTYAASTDRNAGYVEGVYQTLLGRSAEAAALSYWQGQLNKGTARTAFSTAVWNSAEHRGLEVDQFYHTFLGRNADLQGRAFWIDAFNTWGTERLEVAGFVTSDEFSKRLHISDADFVTALYKDLDLRSSDAAGLSSWQTSLHNGESRLQVANAFINGAEASKLLVGSDYGNLLNRPAESASESTWVSSLESKSAGAASLSATILASNEFFTEVAHS